MKRIMSLWLTIVTIVALLVSCSKDTLIDSSESENGKLAVASQSVDSLALKDSLPAEAIVPIEVDAKSLKKRMKTLSDADNVLSDQLFAIREMPFTIQARGGGNTGNLYLASNGKGKEITLSAYSGPRSLQNHFYVKVLPATSGIPYLIYSLRDRTPIAVGQYPSSPDNKVLFSMPDESGSLYSASWNIFNAANQSGYVVIESQSLLGQGDGGWWDVFYHVIEARNDNKVGFGKYQQSSSQEFIIKPTATFTLQDVKYVDDYSGTVTTRENLAVVRTFTNVNYSSLMHDFKFDDQVTESSYFNEYKGVSFTVDGLDKLFKRPTALNGELRATPGDDVQADVRYAPYQQISKKLNGELPTNIPPRTDVKVTFFYHTYDIDVPFEATIRYGDKDVKLRGRWKGTIHVNDLPLSEHIIEIKNLDTGLRKLIKPNGTTATKSNPLTL